MIKKLKIANWEQKTKSHFQVFSNKVSTFLSFNLRIIFHKLRTINGILHAQYFNILWWNGISHTRIRTWWSMWTWLYRVHVGRRNVSYLEWATQKYSEKQNNICTRIHILNLSPSLPSRLSSNFTVFRFKFFECVNKFQVPHLHCQFDGLLVAMFLFMRKHTNRSLVVRYAWHFVYN